MRKYLNQKGSAMVLVLSSLIILMAVGSVVVALSAANISMSRKYTDWSAEYYWLDYAAQDQLGDLDKNVLISGENIARYYLQNSYYKYPAVTGHDGIVGFPSGSGMPGTILAAFSGSEHLQELIYAKWDSIYGPYAAIPVPTEDDEDAYNDDMQAFVSELFKVVYYAYIDGNLSIASYEDIAHDIKAVTSLQNTGWFPDVDTESSFDVLYGHLNQKPQLAVNAKEQSGENPKQVEVIVSVIPPSFTAVQQTRYYAVKPNPLYANALSVRGNITFTGNGSVNIVGDVASSNQNSSGTSLGLSEGNSQGIKTESGSSVAVTIRGNVYSAGDVHLWGSGSSLSVLPYPSSLPSTLALKTNLLYSSGNEYFFDFDAPGNDAQYYTEGYTSANGNPYIPYIYKDDAGGNVYCNNLAVEEAVQNANLSVSGDLWTQDDIQNDGRIGSNIEVAGNYIGMRSDADESNKDPNGSSAVINNGYMYGSTISLGGSYIIPGTAWYNFTGDYYQTAESATARAGEYFGIYEQQPSELSDASKVFKPYYDGSDQYSMYEHETGSTSTKSILADRRIRFSDKISALAGLRSGISVNGSADGFTLGIVNNNGAVVYDHLLNDEYAFGMVSGNGNILDDVFNSKTKCFGTNGSGFSDLIDPTAGLNDSANGFYYYPSNATVNVGTISSGIIYCNGNLTLTGSGTFTGSVICSGNLTVSSGVNIYYDESAVYGVLGLASDGSLVKSETTGRYPGSSIARRFFSPAGYVANETLGVEQVTMLSTSAGERESGGIQRYIVNSWKEFKAS